MSDYQRQQAFGPLTFTDVSASGSSSGLDHYANLEAEILYQDPNYRALHRPMQSEEHDHGYAAGQFAFTSHSSGMSLPDLQYTTPAMAGHPGAVHHYDHETSILDELNSEFSPISPNFNMNTYRTPYPDSTATSTSSATSPDPNTANIMTDPIIIEADEDKRKRNQAASARFRQKKKQREQQLMTTSREMQDRTKRLEAENDGLKKENLFLKKLLVEKVDHMNADDREVLRKVTSEALHGK